MHFNCITILTCYLIGLFSSCEANTNFRYLKNSDYTIRDDIQSVVEPRLIPKIQNNKQQSKISSPSLHILIATTGNHSLFRMLKSLRPQLQTNDYLTVVFDAKDNDNIFEQVKEYLVRFQCSCSLIMEPVNLGYWGHGIRNRHNHLSGDFIMHADDDDVYTNDAMDTVRKYCTDKTTLYIFKMQIPKVHKRVRYSHKVWFSKQIIKGQIGTPMGVIPNSYNSKSIWQYCYGGDFDFYDDLQNCIPKVEFIDHIIYIVKPRR